MKIYISCDIEGVSGLVGFDDAKPGSQNYAHFSNIMSQEVAAVCSLFPAEDQIVVKDAHMFAKNINPESLPNNTVLISGWSGHPFKMVDGLDSTFDALLLVGYHDYAGSDGNPAAHSFNSRSIHRIKINDSDVSEFDIALMTASSLGVPTAFLMGDARITKQAKEILPDIITIATKEGKGASVASHTPEFNVLQIKRKGQELRSIISNKKDCLIVDLPNSYEIFIEYVRHYDAYRNSFFPGCNLISPRCISFTTDSFFEVLRLFSFVI